MMAPEITNTWWSLFLPAAAPGGGASLLAQLGDDFRLSQQRVLLVLELDLRAAELGQEYGVADLEAEDIP